MGFGASSLFSICTGVALTAEGGTSLLCRPPILRSLSLSLHCTFKLAIQLSIRLVENPELNYRLERTDTLAGDNDVHACISESAAWRES